MNHVCSPILHVRIMLELFIIYYYKLIEIFTSNKQVSHEALPFPQ